MVVVILKGHSLFVEGVQNRLQQHLEGIDFQVVDPTQQDTLEQIIALNPSAVIIDDSEFESAQKNIIEKLLAGVPALKVIRLDPRSSWVQVVQWDQVKVAEALDLLDVIDPPSSLSMDQSLTGGSQ